MIRSGYVSSRIDPKGLGRIRAQIPGFLDGESSWLWPFGVATGIGTGDFNPPDVNTPVAVFFFNDNLDNGGYLLGYWGSPGGVKEIPDGASVSENGDVKIYDDGILRIERDSTPGTKGIRIKHSDGTTLLEYDANTRRMKLFASTSVELAATGEMKITGGAVTVNGRRVLSSGDPI